MTFEPEQEKDHQRLSEAATSAWVPQEELQGQIRVGLRGSLEPKHLFSS